MSELSEKINQELAVAFKREEHRLALREHALYCASVLFNGWLIASGGTRPDDGEVTAMADTFVEWLNVRPEGLDGEINKLRAGSENTDG